MQFRRKAEELAGEPPRRMSFERTWTRYRQFLLAAMYINAASPNYFANTTRPSAAAWA